MKKKILFVDRDGVIIREPAEDYQVDSFAKLEFMPGAISGLSTIMRDLDFELVMVTNQDGLGTEAFPQEDFEAPHQLMLSVLKSEGVNWREIIVDHTFSSDQAETRKPRLGRVQHYLQGDFDLAHSFMIGDRLTDMQFAANLGCKGILLGHSLDQQDDSLTQGVDLSATIDLTCAHWSEIVAHLKSKPRATAVKRVTKETQIEINLDVDGSGQTNIDTGLNFFDHMLEQLGKHGGVDLDIKVAGDLEIDEHHTIEDTALALGEAFREALGSKRGTERYGFALPMDEARAEVLLDFGGRPWLVWDVQFKREFVGDMPTEMVKHFFKSFSDTSLSNLQVTASGDNEHHIIESIFKAFARAIRRAVRRDMDNFDLPTTKGTL